MNESLDQIHPLGNSVDSIVGRTIKFRTESDKGDENNRESSVLITKENELLGEGAFSLWVKSVQAKVVSKEKESHDHTFVVKKYKTRGENFEPVDPKREVEKALLNFKKIKQSGAKTWDTYRVSDDDTMIVMTNANIDGKTLVTKNKNFSEEAQKLEHLKLNKIRNFDSFLQSLYEDISKLSKNKIGIEEDVIGIIFNNEGSESGVSDIDFIIADFDNVKGENDFFDSNESIFLLNNLHVVKMFLPKILRRYVKDSGVKGYIEKVQTFCDQKMSRLI